MNEQILFIMEKKVSMIASAMIAGLKKENFDVRQVRLNITDISAIDNPPMIWVWYLQESDHDFASEITFLKDQIEEKDILFFAIGSPKELEETLKLFPKELISGVFERPIRPDEVADALLEAAKKERMMRENKRVLVVDDDPMLLRSIKDMLSDHYRIYTANSGLNAIKLLEKTDIDLILLDYEMPVVNGPQVIEMLKSDLEYVWIPIFFLTAKSDKESVLNAYHLGVEGYLLKSTPKAEIIETIDNFFANDKSYHPKK